jgi:hypothetical protein
VVVLKWLLYAYKVKFDADRIYTDLENSWENSVIRLYSCFAHLIVASVVESRIC